MIRQIFFLIIYFLLQDILPAQLLFALFIVQCSWVIYDDVKATGKLVSMKTLLNAGFILSAAANINLITVAGTAENVTYDYIIIKYISEASLVFIVGASLMSLGIDIVGAKSLPKIGITLNKKYNTILFYILLFVTNSVTMGLLHLTFLGSIYKIIALQQVFGIMYFTRLSVQENSKLYRNYSYILLIASTLIALKFAYLRQGLIIPSFIFLLSTVIAENNLSIFKSARILPFVGYFILFTFVFSALGKYRGQASNIEIISSTFENDEDQDVENTKVINSDEKQSSSLLQRSSNLAPITEIVRLTKERGFYNGQSTQFLLLALVPRFLFPDKPIIALGTWFAVQAGLGYQNESGQVNNSVNMTIPGQCYLDFGWPGVIVICLLVGMFLAVLWNAAQFYSLDYNFAGTIFGAYLAQWVVLGVGADLQIVITFLSTYLIFWAVKSVL